MTDSDVFPPLALKKAAEDVASLLKERKETISVAETAAGGLISAALLSTAGASKIYKASHLMVGRRNNNAEGLLTFLTGRSDGELTVRSQARCVQLTYGLSSIRCL